MTTPDLLDHGNEHAGEVGADEVIENETSAPVGDQPADTSPEPTGETARWRRQARDAEASRDAFAATVERLQRADVLRLAAESLAQPGDLFEIGRVRLDGLLTEDGLVDAGLVATQVFALLSARPGLAVAVDQRQSMPDLGGGRRGSSVTPSTTWTEVLGGR